MPEIQMSARRVGLEEETEAEGKVAEAVRRGLRRNWG